MGSALSSYTELPMQSCESLSSPGVCGQCIPRYYLKEGVCSYLDIGHETETTCYDPYNFNSNVCVGPTGALAGYHTITPHPTTNLSFGSSSWTAQFYYLGVQAWRDPFEVEQGMFDFVGAQATLSLVYKAKYAYSPNVNKLELSFKYIAGSTINSAQVQVPYGEWVLVTFEAHSSNQVYTLYTQDYGSVSISGQAHVSPTQIVFKTQGQYLIPFYKELLIWDSAITDNSQITSHKCRLNHGSQFTPLAQFDLNFNRLATDTQLVDQRGNASPASLTFNNGWTVGFARKFIPSSAELSTNYAYSSASNSPACVECMPSCSECSDIYECATCSTGSLVAGLCLVNAVSPSSGTACSTTFSFDSSQLTVINNHINSELRQGASTSQVSISSANIEYPDLSTKTIADISSFTIPNYYVIGQTSFTATINLDISVNGVTRQGNLPSITLSQPAKTPPECMNCIPNCSVCSDLFVCQFCSTGTLIGGLCITESVSSSSGTACATNFSLNVSQFDTINSHINTQLGVASSTEQVKYTSAKLIYPDSSSQPISDISSFTINNFYVIGLTSFDVTLRLGFSINGVNKEEDFASIAVTQPAKTPPKCMQCMPNCSECSDIYACLSCSPSASLVGALCLSTSVSPSSGEACSTAFSLDVAQFAGINGHINTQLGVASSTEQVVFTAARLVYPNSSSKLVSDLSSFTIDNYYVVGQTSFAATLQLSFTVNGISKQDDLALIHLTQPAKTPPDCMSCMPNCSVCSDIFVCQTCSSGVLISGLCMSGTLSPSTGEAESTLFTFNSSQTSVINTHINSQLGVDSSTKSVSFTYAKLTYPDLSIAYITDTSSFTVPTYKVEGVDSFIVSIELVFSVNGESKKEPLSPISLTQPTYVPANVCGCRLVSECNTATGLCQCETGYAGTLCTFTEAELAAQQAKISTEVDAIASSLNSTTSSSDALSQLSILTSNESAVTDSTALQTTDILSQIVEKASSEAQIAEVVQVQSNLVPKTENNTSQASSIVQSLQALTDLILTTSIQNSTDLSIVTSNIVVNVFPFDPSSPPTSTAQDDVKVTFPSSLSSQCSDTKLSKVRYRGSTYQSLAPSGFIQASDTLSLDLYSCQQKQEVTQLQQEIVIEFPLEQASIAISDKISAILNETLSRDALTCSFFLNQTNSISSEGCRLLDVNATSITCACNHMTDFMAFIKTGEQVLTEANYSVFHAIDELNWSNLKQNIGFYLFIGYWSLQLILLLIVVLLSRRGAKHRFFIKLFISLKSDERLAEYMEERKTQERLDIIENHIFKDKKVHPLPGPQPVKRESTVYLHYQRRPQTPINNKTNSSKSQILAESLHVKAYQMDESFDQINQPQRQSAILKSSEQGLTLKYYTKTQIIKARLLRIVKNEKRCCCACCRLFGDEIATNNQIYNLVKGNSFLVFPGVRLSLLFLAILFEFFLNALFFNLNPTEEDAPLFWDGIFENIWVSLYSFFFCMIPLLLLGLTFSASQSVKKKLKKARDPQELKRIYYRMRKKMRTATIGGMAFFILMSNILLFYIICFCQVANSRMSEDWVRSSAILVVLDLVILELMPGVLFAILGLFYQSCRSNQILLCVILTIQIYRLYRNLIQV